MEASKKNAEGPSNLFHWDNWPNRLTLFRIFLVPVVVLCLLPVKWQWFPRWSSELGWVAGWTFTVAAITDFLDGHIARKKNIVTLFGSFLDPIADKFLVISSLIMLLALERLPVLIVIILVLREVYMTSLRLMALHEGVQVPVNSMGKWKTATQLVGIPMLMADEPLWGIPIHIIGPVLLYLASFLAAYSAFKYTVSGYKKLREKHHHP